MRALISFVLEAFPQAGVRREALDATLADWRYEAAVASTPLSRVAVAVRSSAAVLRAGLGVALSELPSEWRRPWTMRLLVVVAMAFAAFSGLGPIDASLRIIPLLALCVFLAESTGDSQRPSIGLGGALTLAIVAFGLVTVASPELREYRALLQWREQGQAWATTSLYVPWPWTGVLNGSAMALQVVAAAALAGALRAGPNRARRSLLIAILVAVPFSILIGRALYAFGAPFDAVMFAVMPVTLLVAPPLAPVSVVMLLVAAGLRRLDGRQVVRPH